MNLVNYSLTGKYDELLKYGNKLAEMDRLIDWESFRPILKDLLCTVS